MSHDDRCSHPPAEAILRACREAIRRHGWHCTTVFADPAAGDPPFAYTTGLAERFAVPRPHAELVIAGLPPRRGHSVLTAAVQLIEHGERLADGDERDGIIDGFPIRFRAVDLDACNLTFSISDSYYRRHVPRLQLLWPDPTGRFPGEPGCDPRMDRIQDIGG